MASRQERPVRTFSLGFAGVEAESTRPSELSFARMVAHHFHTDHTEIVFDGSDVRNRLCRMLWAMDQPSGDALQHYLLSEAAKTGVTVAISGTGADELFAGYAFFGELVRLDRLSKAIGFVPQPWKVRMGEWLAGCPPVWCHEVPFEDYRPLSGAKLGFFHAIDSIDVFTDMRSWPIS
jgi:asparagine synthase (glutamine-hydrolysing)